MAMVNFKKGLRAGLPATYSEGTFYVTTDERAIYLDVSDSARIRLGDFQEFATLSALTANTNPSTTALYYVSDINCLAKWNGSEYVQINKDTGMTSVEVVGDGNAVTAAVYSADGRKLTLTKGATYMTAADVDSKISAKSGELVHNGTTYETVAEFVNAKTAGIATDAALGDLQNRVSTAEGEIDVLQAAIAEGGSVTVAIADAKKAGTDAQAAAEAAQAAAGAAQATADSKVTMAQVEAKDYATKSEAQGYAGEAKAAADAAQADVDALAGKVGSVPADKTVVQMIADAQSAATYDDAEVRDLISDNADAIEVISGDYLKGADKTELQGKIDAEAARADAAEKVNAAAIAAVKEDVDAFLAAAEVGESAVDTLKEIQEYITTDGTAADKMVKDIGDNKAAIEAEVKRAGEAEAALQALIDAHSEVDHDFASADAVVLASAKEHANGLNTAMNARVEALEAIDHEHANKAELDKIADGDVAKWNAAQANAEATAAGALASAKSELEGKITAEAQAREGADNALSGRLDVLEAINHNAYVAADAQVLADAKAHANGLNSTMDGRVAALEAIDHDAYKGYADQAELDAVATANAHTDAALTWGSF